MKVIITEDIIRNALNKSIDEFMLEEGWLGDRWNSFKNDTVAGQWLTKAGNGLKNAASMYMDWRTKGQWNNKYGIYASGNSKIITLNYLSKWLKYNHDYLANLTQYGKKQDPAGLYNVNYKANRFEGDPRYDPSAYVEKICTSTNFYQWMKQYNRKALPPLDSIYNYITNYITRNCNNVQNALYYLNINSFYNTEEAKEFFDSNSKQEKQDWDNYYNARQNSGAYDTE